MAIITHELWNCCYTNGGKVIDVNTGMETDFSAAIRCFDGKTREFHFARINSVAIYFHVSVVDNDQQLITGTLAMNENGQWQLLERELPDWFMQAEPELCDTVALKAGR